MLRIGKLRRPHSSLLNTLVKYVFLDVVGFTHERSVEAQTRVVALLNTFVKLALKAARLSRPQVALLPTGDGMCIAVIDPLTEFDIHLRVALEILKRIDEHNKLTDERMVRFDVRIGLNENVDNLVVDINDNQNVAGAGINIAQRVMSFADASQILAGPVVYETLRHRERYMNSFTPFEGRDKRGVLLEVFQFTEANQPGLSVATPSAFRTVPSARSLTRLEAYYLAHAIKHQDALIAAVRRSPSLSDAVTMLLWFLAQDSARAEQTAGHEGSRSAACPDASAGVEQTLEHYQSQDGSVRAEFHALVKAHLAFLLPYLAHAERGSFFIVTESGTGKLTTDHPDIAEQFNLKKT